MKSLVKVVFLALCMFLAINNFGFSDDSDELQIINLSPDDSLEVLMSTLDDIDYLLFTRPTCPSCVEFNETLHKILPKYPNIHINQFNTDSFREVDYFNELIDLYNIHSVPTLIALNSGKEVLRFNAESPEPVIVESDLDLFFSKSLLFEKVLKFIHNAHIYVLSLAFILMSSILFSLFKPFKYHFLVLLFISFVLIGILVYGAIQLSYLDAYIYETYALEMPTTSFFLIISAIGLCFISSVLNLYYLLKRRK